MARRAGPRPPGSAPAHGRSAPHPRAWFGSARMAQLSSARLGSARLGSAQLGSARLGSGGSARPPPPALPRLSPAGAWLGTSAAGRLGHAVPAPGTLGSGRRRAPRHASAGPLLSSLDPGAEPPRAALCLATAAGGGSAAPRLEHTHTQPRAAWAITSPVAQPPMSIKAREPRPPRPLLPATWSSRGAAHLSAPGSGLGCCAPPKGMQQFGQGCVWQVVVFLSHFDKLEYQRLFCDVSITTIQTPAGLVILILN